MAEISIKVKKIIDDGGFCPLVSMVKRPISILQENEKYFRLTS